MESGYRTFAENFEECCGQSCSILAYEKSQADSSYVEAVGECKTLYQEIHMKLGTSYQLINQFDAAKNQTAGANERYVYQQGFQDCITLLRWMGAL